MKSSDKLSPFLLKKNFCFYFCFGLSFFLFLYPLQAQERFSNPSQRRIERSTEHKIEGKTQRQKNTVFDPNNYFQNRDHLYQDDDNHQYPNHPEYDENHEDHLHSTDDRTLYTLVGDLSKLPDESEFLSTVGLGVHRRHYLFFSQGQGTIGEERRVMDTYLEMATLYAFSSSIMFGPILKFSLDKTDQMKSIHNPSQNTKSKSEGFYDPIFELIYRMVSQDHLGPLNLDWSFRYSPDFLGGERGNGERAGSNGRGGNMMAFQFFPNGKFEYFSIGLKLQFLLYEESKFKNLNDGSNDTMSQRNDFLGQLLFQFALDEKWDLLFILGMEEEGKKEMVHNGVTTARGVQTGYKEIYEKLGQNQLGVEIIYRFSSLKSSFHLRNSLSFMDEGKYQLSYIDPSLSVSNRVREIKNSNNFVVSCKYNFLF